MDIVGAPVAETRSVVARRVTEAPSREPDPLDGGVVAGMPHPSTEVSLPEISLADLHRRVGVDRRRLPLKGTIELTARCNLRCVHCYVRRACDDAEARGRELPPARLVRLLDEIADAGTLFLLLTGGEVLIRTDFPEIYRHAVRRGLIVTVFTNGTLLSERVLDLLDRDRPEAVEVTLYGMTQETYERVTRVPGSYARCMKGVEALLSRGIALRLKSMALASNQHEVAAMAAYARAAGVPFRFDAQLNARVDGGTSEIASQQLSAEEAWQLDQVDPERTAELRGFCERRAQPRPGARFSKLINCGAAWGTFTIDGRGQLLPCELLRSRGFDLHHASFEEGWQGSLPRWRELRFERNDACPRCNLASLCGSCPGAAELETGRSRRHRAPFLRDRAPAGLLVDGRAVRSPSRRELLLGARFTRGLTCPTGDG